MDDLRDRVEAVERAITDGDGDLTALAEGAASADRIDSLEGALEALQEDVAELEAATRALRGYVGNVRSVNESVEERADAAIAAVESIEDRLPEEPMTGGSNPDSGMVEGGPATDDRQVARGSDSGETGARSSATQCGTCGGPLECPPAADGGRVGTGRSSSPQGNVDDRSAQLEQRATPGESRSERQLEGYDPDAAGPRVTVRREAKAPSTDDGRSARREERSEPPTLLERLREWL